MSLPDGPLLDDEALWELDEDPGAVLGALHGEFGELFTIHRAEAAPRVVLTTGQHVRELITHEPELRACGTSQFAQLVGESSVNMLSGEPHRRMRQLLLGPIRGHALSARVPDIRRIVCEEIDRLSKTPVALLDFTSEIALRVTTSLLFPPMPGTQVRELWAPLLRILDSIHRHRSLPPASRTAEARASAREEFLAQRVLLDRNVMTLIARRRAQPEADTTSLLGQLLAAPEALSDRQVRDQLVTMLVAGHLTTASGLAMAAYWMYRPGAHATEAIAELDALGAEPGAAQLAGLRHLTAFCDEVLRVGSIVPHTSGRRTSTTTRAFGHDLPAGTELVVSIQLAHRRAESFPRPEQFRPRRFIEHAHAPTDFVPFGLGSRRCPGATLVGLETKIFLAQLRRAAGLELIGTELPFETVSLGSTLAPPAKIQIRLASRTRAR